MNDQMLPNKTENETPTRRKGVGLHLVVVAAMLAGLGWWFGRPTSTPAFFDTSISLDEAIVRAQTSGRVVYAYATADWCGPCKRFKKGALADERVVSWMNENAVSVYIDVDDNPADAARLGVQGIPASFIIADGDIVDMTVGALPADWFHSWLQQAHAKSSIFP